MTARRARPLAVSMGEPAGIGPDLVLAAWVARRRAELPAFFVLADPALLADRARRLGLAVPIREIAADEAASRLEDALPVVPLEARAHAEPGKPDPRDPPAVIEAIRRAVELVHAGAAAAVVTPPIAKAPLTAAGFAHPGHTEYLGELARELWGIEAKPVMMLWAPELAVVPVTVHVPLAAVPRLLTTELIVRTGRIVDADLRTRFGLPRPRLALAGLNPHAGEAGTMGREDLDVIAPAVESLRAAGIEATGPHPADTLFHAAARQRYDAVLAMYHDQALIPIKTIAFDSAVNVTLGLPFVRTSPDHGTAFDIAGTGRASPASFFAALRLAARLALADASMHLEAAQ
jgi:4-hydroxythreonine-4-phosphate dehydrogenase